MDLRTDPRPLILVLDDDAAVRRALAFTLDLAGYEVEAFDTGEALLLSHSPQRADCLVIDERLPGLSGLDALREIRVRELAVPAILVTSHPSAAFRAAAQRAGAPILEKPLLADTLVSKIRDLLGQPAELSRSI